MWKSSISPINLSSCLPQRRKKFSCNGPERAVSFTISALNTESLHGINIESHLIITLGWYISFCCEKEIEIPENDMPSVGIDRGISETLVLSTDQYGESSFTLSGECKKLRERIKVLQRRLKKKKKFSNNWHKAQKRVRQQHSKIARTRKDFLHKTSSEIAKNHSYVALEDLKIKNMSKSAKGGLESPGRNVKAKSGLNREILFQGWGMFATMLDYKCHRSGGHLELVDPKMTSQRCSVCLYQAKENRKRKVFKCLNCGHESDADKNAAKNIVRAGRARRDCGEVAAGQLREAVTSSFA